MLVRKNHLIPTAPVSIKVLNQEDREYIAAEIKEAINQIRHLPAIGCNDLNGMLPDFETFAIKGNNLSIDDGWTIVNLLDRMHETLLSIDQDAWFDFYGVYETMEAYL